MFDEPANLSSDLEWMLQSGRAGDEALADALVRGHYAEIYLLALSALKEPVDAEAAAVLALADAILNADHYRAELGVRGWLLSLLEKRAGLQENPEGFRFEDLPELDLSEKKLERLIAEVRVAASRERRQRRVAVMVQEILVVALAVVGVLFAGRLVRSANPGPTSTPNRIRTVLETRVVYISPKRKPSATPTPLPERAILYTAEAGDTLASIAGKTGVEVQLLQALNDLDADATLQPGQAVMIGVGGKPMSQITPTPVTPAAPAEPLTTASSQAEIARRIIETERHWHTLWADAQAIDYGPPGFVGPPTVKRIQAWVSWPFYTLVLTGRPDGHLEKVSLTNSGTNYLRNYDTGQHWISSTSIVDLSDLLQQPLRITDLMGYDPKLEVSGIGQVAGREALIVDWYGYEPVLNVVTQKNSYRGRLWVDTRTGAILRMQVFEKGQDGKELVTSEYLITRIAYDVDFPNALFDQYRPLPTAFARDYTGKPFQEGVVLPTPTWVPQPGREPLPRIAPPPDYDPARSRLTFQWRRAATAGSDAIAEVFAGRYYIGSMPFPSPDRLICARSPDGRLIAFAESFGGQPYVNAPLRWIDLADLSRVYYPSPEVSGPGDLAFSPDSSQLAVLGGLDENITGLYLVDLASGRSERILDLYGGYNLAWSPDGREIALTGADNPNTYWRLLVVDAGTGEISYNGPIDFGQDGKWTLPEDAPVRSWGVSFSLEKPSGIEACAAPP